MTDTKTETIQLGSIETAEGTNDRGDWKRWDVKDGNGRRFVTFSSAVGDAARGLAGQRAEIDFEEKQREGRPPDLILKAVRPAKAESNGGWKRDPDESRRIARQACLKASVEFETGRSGRQLPVELVDVLETADKFVAWVYQETDYQSPDAMLPDYDDSIPF